MNWCDCGGACTAERLCICCLLAVAPVAYLEAKE